jgi:hypothetical protein
LSDSPEPKDRSRLKDVRNGLIVSAASLILLILSLETVGYLWERKTAQESNGWTLVASRRLEMELSGDQDSPYTLLVPNRSYNWEGIDVRIGPQGLRNPEITVPKPSGTFRILNLGDSIAFGWEVPEAASYGRVLDDLLNEAAAASLTFEVINAGVPTWNMESEGNYLLEEGLRYEPDLVILEFSVVNDVLGQGVAIRRHRNLLDWLRDETYFWPFLTTEARFLLARQQGPEAIPVLNPRTNPEAYFPIDPADPVYDRVWSYIERIRAAGVPMMIVLVPTAFQVNSYNHPDTPQQVLTQQADSLGIPVLDLRPVYLEVCEQAGPEACEGYENEIFADVWMHPNVRGHRIAAESLLAFIRAHREALGLP